MFPSKKGTKKYLKQKLNGDIEAGAIEFIQTTIQTTLDDFCIEAKKLKSEQDQFRKDRGLREKKRFSKNLFIRTSQRLKGASPSGNIGESGRVNENTLSSGSNFMKAEQEGSCSKKAVIGVDVQ